MRPPFKLATTIQTRMQSFGGCLLLVVGLTGGSLLATSMPAYAACQPSGTTYGTDTLHASAPSSSTYVVWTRLSSPSSSKDSIMLEVDGGSCYTVGGSSSMPANSLTWVNYINGSTSSPLHISLSQGVHTFKYIGTNPNMAVDLIILLASSNSCVPTGNGQNCVPPSSPPPPPPPPPTHPPTPPPPHPPSGPPTGGSTSTTTTNNSAATVTTNGGLQVQGASGTITETRGTLRATRPITLSPADTKGVVKVQYYLNNKLLATLTNSPFSYRLNIAHYPNGTYTLTTKEYLSSGGVRIIKQTLIIANPTSVTQLRLILQKYMFSGWTLSLLVVLFIAAVYVRGRFKDRVAQSSSYVPPSQPEARVIPSTPNSSQLPPAPMPPLPPNLTTPPASPDDSQSDRLHRYPWR